MALRAIALLGGVRVALRTVPFLRLQRWTAGPKAPYVDAARGPREVRRAVIRATRTLPGSTCLAQSLVAQRLLSHAGYPSALHIGVARPATASERRAIEAHAWLESGGIVVAGDGELARFAKIPAFDHAP